MDSLNTILWLVKEKFHGKSFRIDQLYEENASFRSLCVDYHFCVRTLDTLNNGTTEELKTIRQYTEMCVELEKELHDFLLSS